MCYLDKFVIVSTKWLVHLEMTAFVFLLVSNYRLRGAIFDIHNYIEQCIIKI